MINTPVYQEWVKEERAEAEGRAKGRIEQAREVICQ